MQKERSNLIDVRCTHVWEGDNVLQTTLRAVHFDRSISLLFFIHPALKA